jgi:hypothetical protein
MRTYHVRVFVPKVYEIQAESEEHACEAVAQLYKELYKQDIRTWIEQIEQPEDVQ